MVRLAANLDWLYTELPFADRFGAAAADGFEGVELLFPHDHDLASIASTCRTHRLHVALVNAPAGDWAAGDRGLALGEDLATWRTSLEIARDVATTLGCSRVHVLTGIGDADRDRGRLVGRLRDAGDLLGADGITVCIEPLNPADVPGYALPTLDEAVRLVRDVAHQAVRLQFDAYHVARVHGGWREPLAEVVDLVAHVQLAGSPARDEPDHGPVAGTEVLEALDRAGYSGWVGAEYRPRSGTSAGLGWAGSRLGPRGDLPAADR